MDEVRAARPTNPRPAPVTWLTHPEFSDAAAKVFFDDSSLTRSPPIDHVADLYVLATWRVSQGIYRFDPELQRALTDTRLDVRLPADLLEHLPEWAVYVETPGLMHFARHIAGMFATLFYGPSGQSLQLTLVPETIESIDDDFMRLQLLLGTKPLRQTLADELAQMGARRASILSYVDDVNPQPAQTENDRTTDAIETLVAEIAPFISLLLYLCTDEPDLEQRPSLPTGTRTKTGVRFFPPPKPQVRPVGVRMGSTLRAAREIYERAVADSGSGRRLRPHVRAAHFQRFAVGTRNAPVPQRRLRWVLPTLVNCGPETLLPAVIHPIEPV
jgi:hypothetical protein